MDSSNRIPDLLFSLLMGTLYTYALAQFILSATILELSPREILTMSAVAIAVFTLLFFNKYTLLATVSLLLLTLLSLFVYLRYHQFQVEWYQSTLAYTRELIAFSRDQIPYKAEYNLPIGLAVAATLAFLAVLNIHVYYNFYLLSLLGICVIAAPILLGYETSQPAFVLFLLCFIIFLTKTLNLFAVGRTRESRRANAGFILAFIPFCAVILGVSYLLPKPANPMADNSGSGEISGEYTSWTNSLDQTGNTAFTDTNTSLGGEIAPNNQFVMEVYTEERTYLSGKILDTYTGSSWKLSDETTSPLGRDGEGWYPVNPIAPDLWDDFWDYEAALGAQRKTLTVQTVNRTRNIFSPAFQTRLSFHEDVTLLQNPPGALTVESYLDTDTQYTLEYLSWSAAGPRFPEALAELNRFDTGVNLTPYLQLPDSLPDRVFQLTREITDGAGSNYEKLMALQQYLIRFPYTLTPKAPGPEEDFVDFFLFTGQEGYCTYYSTAFAVMARTIGIPTRYLEGYVLPQTPTGKGSYLVTNAQAHAWTEAYFPGFGWVAFEATAPYSYDFYDEELPSPEEVFAPDMMDNEEELDRLGFPAVPDPERGQPEPAPLEDSPFPLGRVLLLLLLAFLAAGGKWGWDRFCLWRIGRLPPREAVIGYFSCLLRSARSCGYPIQPEETAKSYAHRMEDQFLFDGGRLVLSDLAELFAKASYSTGEITSREKALMRACCQELRSQILRHRWLRFQGFCRSQFSRLRRHSSPDPAETRP